MKVKNKLKIAFIHPDLGIGGAERLVLDVATALTNQGHQVVFLTNHFDKSHAFEELKTEQFPVEVYGDWLPRSIFGKAQALCAYIRMVYLTIFYVLFCRRQEDNKPDLYFVDSIPVAIPILKWAGEKVVYYCHHPDLLASTPGGKLKALYRKPIDWLELKSTGRADVILVNSEYTKSVFYQTFPEITKPIQVLYPTIATNYQETVARLLTNCRPITEIVPEITSVRNFVFLSVNRFHPAKRLELAVLALDVLKEQVTKEEWAQIYLILAGGYDPQNAHNAQYFDQLKNLVLTRNLMDKVIFLKSPSDETKTELLLECHAVLYTPVNEHFGIVPLEAMTVNKPVIAVNSGGPMETVEQGVTGFLCEPNPEAMAGCMKKILDKKLAIEMGTRGKARLEKYFHHSSFSKRLQTVIHDDSIRKIL